MEHDVRFFGEVKPPKNIQKARTDMVDYLDSDLGHHAIAILTDGFDWELWIRPRNLATNELDNPYAATSLRSALKTVRTRNMSVEPYRSHTVRNQIDVDGFSTFKSDTIKKVIQKEFDVNKAAWN